MNRSVFIFSLCIWSVCCMADNKELEQQLKDKYGYVYSHNYYYEVGPAGSRTACDMQGNELVSYGLFKEVRVVEDSNYKYATVQAKNDKWGVYDIQKQRLIFEPVYDEISLSYTTITDDKGYVHVRNNGLSGIINIPKAEETLKPSFRRIHYMETDYGKGWAKCDDKYIHLPSKQSFDEYEEFYYLRRFAVRDGNKWGMIDTLGTQLLPIEYEDKPFRTTDMLCLKKNGKYGYVDYASFQPVTEFIYERAGQFNNDVAQVMINGKWEMLPNPRKVVAQQQKTPKGKKKAVSTFPAPNSDVDSDIPVTKNKAENTFAYIIANENYDIAKVPYALNDGWIFEQYCRKTLGIPEKNIHLYEDATAGNIIACVENLKETARAYEGDANIIFYYAGHAFPDEEEHSAYLLPIDGNSQNIATAYSLKKLYRELNSVPIKQLACFIDACFSGTTRSDDMLLAGRAVAIKVRDDIPQGNMVVFTSATGAETAHSYEEKGHGLYTYYLLQKLQQSEGNVTLGELTDYVRKMVRRKSVVVNDKMQTPTVIASPSAEAWQNWKLK